MSSYNKIIKQLSRITICLILGFMPFYSSCSQYVSDARRVAESSSNPEISKFLQYYENQPDRKKLRAAHFLVANMPGKYSINTKTGDKVYDTDIVVADSLIFSLETSFDILNESPYMKEYRFSDFCEYILPYRIENEPICYYWKADCKKWLEVTYSNIEETAKEVNRSIRINIIPTNVTCPKKSYREIKETGYGKCEDRAILLVMALRSLGIPAAYEYVPLWGSNNNGHSFVSVINSDGSIIPLANTDDKGEEVYLTRKTPKVYRKIYSKNHRLSYSGNLKDIEKPPFFKETDILDVTSLHKIGIKDVKLYNHHEKLYLSVFSPHDWVPVAASSQSGFFPDVGTGVIFGNQQNTEAIGLGDGILYLPTIIVDGRLQPAGVPLIISENGEYSIKADTTKTLEMTVYRKYPLNTRILSFAKSMVGGVFEGANSPDFSDAEVIYKITEIPECRMQEIDLPNNGKKYRYIRYLKRKGIFSIAEMTIYNIYGQKISFQPISCQPLADKSEVRAKVFDDDPLTYFETSGGIDLWVGADLGKPTGISKIGFAPRNDDNSIYPGDVYELFYWDGYWKSLEIQQATDYLLTFSGIPSAGLYLLKDLTRGEEIRPFTYENGQQKWW